MRRTARRAHHTPALVVRAPPLTRAAGASFGFGERKQRLEAWAVEGGGGGTRGDDRHTSGRFFFFSGALAFLWLTEKTSFAGHVLESIFFLIRKRRGALASSATENHSREEPGETTTNKGHQGNMFYSKITPEIRYKFATENGTFPKCATSVLGSYRIPRS